MNFIKQLAATAQQQNSLVCVGLDPDPTQMPTTLRGKPDAIYSFCTEIVAATADLVCAYKPQIAYFAALGAEEQLKRIISFIKQNYPQVPVILDAKRGDIGSTAKMYADEAFVRYDADAVTVNPYLGFDSIEPFVKHADRGVIILCRTSNPSAIDLQDVPVGDGKLYHRVAELAASRWNGNGNVALVVGATYPRELGEIRAIIGDMPILVPGIGAQGGDVAAVMASGKTASGGGLVINSARAILYASGEADFAAAARTATLRLRDEINACR